MKYSPVVEDYFQKVIKKSWTWNKLTETEKQRFIDMNFDRIKGSDKIRIEWLCMTYEAFLIGLGYEPIGWRETEKVPQF